MDWHEWLRVGIEFHPLADCYLWNPVLMWAIVIGNAGLVFAYFGIPYLLWKMARRKRDDAVGVVALLFASFIGLCGVQRVVEVITIFWPLFWVDAFMRIITAGVSIFTYVTFSRMQPTIAALPTFKDAAAWGGHKHRLERELADCKASIDRQVAARTAALEAQCRTLNDVLNAFAPGAEDPTHVSPTMEPAAMQRLGEVRTRLAALLDGRGLS
jgi:hypothetical protein